MTALLADAVLVVHFGVVVFVVGGLVAVVTGNRAGWRWVNRRDFRLVHLAAVVIVAVQPWLALQCPLTTLESWLRRRAGAPAYEQSFVADWIERLLFYAAPAWAFTLAYTVFALLVIAAWRAFPPRGKAPRHATLGSGWRN